MEQHKKSMWRKAGVFMTLGAEVAAVIGGAAYLGHFLDERFGTGPYGILTLVTLATVGVFWRMFAVLRWLEKDDR